MEHFAHQLPKAELHLHIEGTLEPELMFRLAHKNKINIPYNSVAEVKKAYNFHNLQSFLDIYYQAADVLITPEDFYDLTWAYFEKAKSHGVKHAEIFFDPQTHTARNIPFAVVAEGILQALKDAKSKLNISSHLILCFLRHLSEEDAFKTLTAALPYKNEIIAVGLDSSEKNNPPEKFKNVFNEARKHGFLTVAHAGEEGSSDYIWQAIQLLDVKRIDHGVRCVEDPKLLNFLLEKQLPLTICPLSNIKLCVYENLNQHPLKFLLEKNICVTINSDDPAYFGGYIADNYAATAKALNLSNEQLKQIAINSFHASFLSADEKKKYIAMVD